MRDNLAMSKPRDLAGRMRARRDGRPDDGYHRETFKLPLEAARDKARDQLRKFPNAAYMTVVEDWRVMPDGDIEFTMRRLKSAD